MLPRSVTRKSQNKIADLGSRPERRGWRSGCRNCRANRSEFFGRLRTILGNRPDIRIVGDRFVFQSESIFFDTGQAVAFCPKAAPNSIMWRARPDRSRQADPERNRLGAAGRRPYRRAGRSTGPIFKSNWELSSARAISVVQYLVFARRAAASGWSPPGFAEFQPLDTARHRGRLQAQPPHRAEADGNGKWRRRFYLRPYRNDDEDAAIELWRATPGSRPTPRSILPARGCRGGASAGAANWCRRPRSSVAEQDGATGRIS